MKKIYFNAFSFARETLHSPDHFLSSLAELLCRERKSIDIIFPPTCKKLIHKIKIVRLYFVLKNIFKKM